MLPAMLLVVSLASMDKHQLHVHHVQHMEHLAHERQIQLNGTNELDKLRHIPARDQDDVDMRTPHVASGTLNCSGLESLWESAGGSQSSAFVAAEIAMAESSGQQYATGPAGERGYWQIHPDHGSLSTYDAFGNAKAAVIISDDGRNWAPWSTYDSGAYIGRC